MLLALSWAGCADEEAAEAARVRIEDFSYREMPGGARILTGTLYNSSDRPIAHAQIQVSLYDGSNRRVGSMIVPVRGIQPGERQYFREPVRSEEDVRGARARSVLVR